MNKEEAMKILKDFHDKSALFLVRTALDTIIPELRESEDEAIRKAILELVKQSSEILDKQNQNNMINWLEKQGEKKSVDKVEPFDKYEGLTDFERTLADICIGWIGEEPGWKQYIKDNADMLLKIAIKKFNSVQDIPFEQKPAEWSEEDDYNVQCLVAKANCDIQKGNVGRNEELIDWLKSLRNRVKSQPDMVEALRTEYEKGRADTIAEMEKDWSEEDDVMINKLLAVVKLYYDRSGDDLDKQSCISFLKSLKDKVQPQPKQEWSEEDEIARKALINLVEMYYGGCIDKTEKKRLLNLLKSLRPQNTWKPSEEQLECLHDAINHYHTNGYPASKLNELYEQMSKIYKL